MRSTISFHNYEKKIMRRKRGSHVLYIYIFFHHTTCEITCDTLASSAANQGDNTVSVEPP